MFFRQFLRWGLVGIGLNLAGYAVYLALTRWLLGPKLAMTLVFLGATGLSFLLNSRWSFAARMQIAAFVRYLFVYAGAYATNLATLDLLVDRGGMRHEYVQGAMVAVIPLATFLLQRYWVFSGVRRTAQPGRHS